MTQSIEETQLTNQTNAYYGVVCGVTYYKLISEFEGDTTKNCGLLGEEVDRNFYFLRGYDIDTISEEHGNLIFSRVDSDYDNIVIALPQPDFEYLRDDGILRVTYPNGDVKDVEGFCTAYSGGSGSPIFVKIFTDETLVGDGTSGNVLGINKLELCGQYAPANEYLDLTLTPSVVGLSACTEGNGYRVLTKEFINDISSTTIVHYGENFDYVPTEDEIENASIFCLNEWDGEKWNQKVLRNGSSIVILKEVDGKPLHEWRIKNKTLVDTDFSMSDIMPTIIEINDKLYELSGGTVSEINNINSNITTFSGSTVNEIDYLKDAIGNLSGGTVPEINEIKNTINQLSANTINEVDNLNEKLNTLSASTITNNTDTNIRIDELSASTTNEFNNVYTAINNLNSDIQTEINNLDDKIDVLDGKINTLSAGTINDNQTTNIRIDNLSASTTTEITNINNKLNDLSGGTINEVNNLKTLINNEISQLSSSTQYTVAQDSISYLSINNREIGTIVDHGPNGIFSKTLSTTNYVDSGDSITLASAKTYTDDRIRVASGHIVYHVDEVDAQIYQKTVENKNAIELLNGSSTQPGSVINTFYLKLDDALIAKEILTPQTITEEDSLIREISYDPEHEDIAKYYVSNKASDMKITVSGNTYNLQDYILELQNTVTTLQNRLENIENNLVQTIKNTIDIYITGRGREIKVEKDELTNRLIIGFDDDAIFG